VQGVLDRFGQIAPKVLFAADGYYYNGKVFNTLEKLPEIVNGLPSVKEVVLVPYVNLKGSNGVLWDEFLKRGEGEGPPEFPRLPFDHPVYILYSSGTTGAPKCIVHGAGGTLLQHLKEHQLHCDIKPDDRIFYVTSSGWMMWNWQVSALASGATLVLYDGSPFYPDGNVLFDFADEEGMTLFGVSAKYIDAVHKAGLEPMQTHSLETVRTITSTGSPLMPESFDFVYRVIKKDVCLASISGGTDIISCFALGNPIGPVWRGELQTRGLGMAVEVFDSDGNGVRGEKGELVCTAPFPSMPVSFWNDSDDRKYRAAYFEKFPNVWCHGDFVELSDRDGLIIYGRSDAILNPGGVRIGTAEIYRQVEQVDEVLEGLVVGQEWKGDMRLVLFVVLRPEISLSEKLKGKIKKQIREHATPRHVPSIIIQVPELPKTKNGKIVELAAREMIHNRPIMNKEVLVNPKALEAFIGHEELKN
jgi:acetoacetyl-CoA synthetase